MLLSELVEKGGRWTECSATADPGVLPRHVNDIGQSAATTELSGSSAAYIGPALDPTQRYCGRLAGPHHRAPGNIGMILETVEAT